MEEVEEQRINCWLVLVQTSVIGVHVNCFIGVVNFASLLVNSLVYCKQIAGLYWLILLMERLHTRPSENPSIFSGRASRKLQMYSLYMPIFGPFNYLEASRKRLSSLYNLLLSFDIVRSRRVDEPCQCAVVDISDARNDVFVLKCGTPRNIIPCV